MKFFKTQADRTSIRYEITLKEFKRVTEEKYPYLQIHGSQEARYGICPSCLNPIQLKGLESKKINPYGAHAGEDVTDLRSWDLAKYTFCPYASHRKAPCDDYEPLEIDDGIVELYNLLKDQFDRIVYIISNEFGIQCSTGFWKEALEQFLAIRGYCYPWLTESNLPYIFAYKGMQQKTCMDKR